MKVKKILERTSESMSVCVCDNERQRDHRGKQKKKIEAHIYDSENVFNLPKLLNWFLLTIYLKDFGLLYVTSSQRVDNYQRVKTKAKIQTKY